MRWGLLVVVVLGATLGLVARADQPGSLSARIDGRSWIATQVTAITFRFGPSPALNIAGQRDGPPSTRLSFNLVLAGDADYQGSFALAPPRARSSNASFLLNLMMPDSTETTFNFTRGELVIERYDAQRQTVSGRFSGAATNLAQSRSIAIEDGRFANIPVLGGR